MAVLPPAADAVPYEEVYSEAMQKLHEWNVVQGYSDGLLHPERLVTRAQFVAMINRAYGYTETGQHPFRDVAEDAWYADDIAIAYNAGYFTGTSNNTASPNTNLSRQQAMTLLAKNMRLDQTAGEVTEFVDGYAFAPYASGYVKAAVDKGLIGGYPDNTFRPEEPITRGAMGLMLYRALGTLVNQPGVHELGNVYGNVTVSAPNATLRNTTVSGGDLFVSGGLGLGSVTLENVDAKGSIVIAGTGESETGDESVILRNVTTDNLKVDSLAGQYLSLRSEGRTDIANTSVRSDAYIQDRTAAGEGLRAITLDGDSGANYTLTGNVETVTNKTPAANIKVASGTVEAMTMDEKGTAAKLDVDASGTVKALNLDTGTAVTGSGDVENLVVNTTGSTVEMLPDDISIRPGITSTVNKATMDTAKGRESSADPRLLAGYPKLDKITPTGATAVFAANKGGTVYWAVSGVTDGSVDEMELLNPSAYGSKALKSGTVTLSAANTEGSAAISGLTSNGAYYLASVLVDARGTHSPLKVESFSTPDGAVPNFASGYPSIVRNTYDHSSTASDKYEAQLGVMANKSCQMYWAVYYENSVAPTAADFRAGSLAGSLQNGVMTLTRNQPSFLDLLNLEELSTYDVYLWLTDADYAQSSAVRKISFTTVDGTPPIYEVPMASAGNRANGVSLTCTLNEAATIYWVAVPAGTAYPVPPAGSTTVTSTEAIAQIVNGRVDTSIGKAGSVRARAMQPVNISITGLKPETAYDVWYIAQDAAGNYTYYPPGDLNNPDDPDSPRNLRNRVMITVNTLDNIAPTVTQEFTRYLGSDLTTPYADTDIRLVFSEEVQRNEDGARFLMLYQAVVNAADESARAEARETLAEALKSVIRLYDGDAAVAALVTERTRDNQALIENWVIDYRFATVTLEGTHMVVTFPTNEETGGALSSSLRLSSGTHYYFTVSEKTAIADTSDNRNIMPATRLDRFRTISSQVNLDPLSLSASNYPQRILNDPSLIDRQVDMSFTMTPISTAMTDPSTCWDMLLWADTSCKYEMYVRRKTSGPDGAYIVDASTDETGWRQIMLPDGETPGIGSVTIPSTMRGQMIGQSLHFNLSGLGVGETPRLQDLGDDIVYEYAIRFTDIAGNSERSGWSHEINFRVSIVAGSSVELNNLAANITQERFRNAVTGQILDDIGMPNDLAFRLTKAFLDSAPPSFASGRPVFEPSDTSVNIRLQMNRAGTVYYALAPADGTIVTRDHNGLAVDRGRMAEVPASGSDVLTDSEGNAVKDQNGQNIPLAPFWVETPAYLDIVDPEFDNDDIKTGAITISSGTVPLTVTGLIPETDYFAYFVLRGTGQTYSDVQIFRFTTTAITRPVLTLNLSNPSVTISSNREAEVDYMVVNYNVSALNQLLRAPFWDNTPSGERSVPGAFPSYGSINNVLQAIATNLATADDGGSGSVFDKYATDSYKDQLAEYIRAASSNTAGTIIGVGHGLTVAPARSQTIDCGNYPMSERTQYAFLAVGRSPQGSGDAFRAIYPLTVVDSDPPKVIRLNSTLRMDTEGTGGDKTILETCSGIVSLTFSEYLYDTDDSASPPILYQVDRGPLLSAKRENTNAELRSNNEPEFISVGYLVQSMSTADVAELVLEEENAGVRTLTVDVRFKNAYNGEYVTFVSDLCDQYSNVQNVPLSLNVRIERVRTLDHLDENGEAVYELVPTPLVEIPELWDARESRTS